MAVLLGLGSLALAFAGGSMGPATRAAAGGGLGLAILFYSIDLVYQTQRMSPRKSAILS